MLLFSFVSLAVASSVLCHQTHFHVQDDTAHLNTHSNSEEWAQKFGKQNDYAFSGPLAFSHLPYQRCLEHTLKDQQQLDNSFDIAIIGLPFDTATSYRPGARFGPFSIRSGSRMQGAFGGWTLGWKMNPYDSVAHGVTVIDCGDVPVTAVDNLLAMEQIRTAYSSLLARPVKRNLTGSLPPSTVSRSLSLDGMEHPRILSLGGDHTIVLPILRSLHAVYGPITVIHFDAHLDTWPAPADGGQSRLTHGSFFYLAHEENLMSNRSIHAGIRCKLGGPGDLKNDEEVGFELISTDDLDEYGTAELVRRIRTRVGDNPVYLSLDIDVIDPGSAPATGTPEAGGWSPREVKRIIRGFKGLNIVGADIVEVAPAYDHAEVTGIAAAHIAHDFLSLMISGELDRQPSGKQEL